MKRRAGRTRSKVFGTAARPRLSVFKSNHHFYAQLINDDEGKTLAAASDKEIKSKNKTKKAAAYEIGKLIAKKAGGKGIANAVFDRGGYKFHGAVLEMAKGAREGGLKF